MARSSELESYWSYLMAAFHRRTRIPFLGDLPLNKMALAGFAVLGIANPGFWFLGAAGELLYLFLRSSSPRFQKLIAAERLASSQHSWSEKIDAAVARLEPTSRARYRRLVGTCRQILGLQGSVHDDSLGSFRDLRARSLNQLLAIYLRLLASREAIVANIGSLDEKALAAEITDLERRVGAAGVDTALVRSLQGTLEIQRKRLENRHRATATLAVIDAELVRIERQVELIREEAAVSGQPEQLSDRLDSVTNTMAETSRWIDAQTDLFGPLGVDAIEAPPELPRVLEGGEP